MARGKGRLVIVSICILSLLANLLPILTQPTSAHEHTTAAAIVVDPANQYQLQGWGTSLAWWANAVGGWSDQNRNAVDDLVFAAPPRGLGLNVVRYNLGAGANAAHCPAMGAFKQMPTFEPADGQWDWNADANQVRVAQDAQRSGANVFEAFSNSPPSWMTASGCSSGQPHSCLLWVFNCHFSDNLPAENYDKYAQYLATVVQHFHDDVGITFDTVEPFNESNSFEWPSSSCQMNGGCQEGANFSPSTQNEVIHRVCNALNAKGISYTALSAPDENVVDLSIKSFQAYDDAAKACVTQINTHGYSGLDPYKGTQRPNLASLAQQNGKRLWMSEFGTGGNLATMEPAFKLSGQLLQDMQRMHPNAWVYWQAVENAAAGGGWGLIRIPFDHEGLTQCTPDAPANPCTKQYYAMGNYSEFIRPGYQILGVNDPQTLAAYDPASGALVLVTTNTSATDRPLSYDLSAFADINGALTVHRTSATEDLDDVTASTNASIANGTLSAVAKANSITTYVVSGVSLAPVASTKEAGHVLMATTTTSILDGAGRPVHVRCSGQGDGNGAVLPQGYNAVVVNDNASYQLNGHVYVRVAYPDPCVNGMDYSSNQAIADGTGAVGWVALDALAETVHVHPAPQFGAAAWRDCWGPDQCGDASYPRADAGVLTSKDVPVLYAWWTGSSWDVHWWHVRDQNGNEASVYGRDWSAGN